MPWRGSSAGFWFMVGGRLRLGWCAKASCYPFRARSSTLAPLAGAGCLHPPAPGGGSPYFGVLERKEGSSDFLTSSPSTVPHLAHLGPAIPEVEELSLLISWSKFCPCCRSSLAGKGHPVYPPFSLQNSRKLWRTGPFTHTELCRLGRGVAAEAGE